MEVDLVFSFSRALLLKKNRKGEEDFLPCQLSLGRDRFFFSEDDNEPYVNVFVNRQNKHKKQWKYCSVFAFSFWGLASCWVLFVPHKKKGTFSDDPSPTSQLQETNAEK